MNVSRDSYRPSGPIPEVVAVYPERRVVSNATVGAVALFLFLLALALTVYMFLSGGQ